MFEVGAVVIPNITFPTEESADFALDGYGDCSVVAISTKGHMDDPAENLRLRANIGLTVDKLTNLKTIIAYDVCSTNDTTLDTFSYAIERGIEVVIPDNTLKNRNMTLYQERHTRKAVVSRTTAIRDLHMVQAVLRSSLLKMARWLKRQMSLH